jgi:hypothetical protein
LKQIKRCLIEIIVIILYCTINFLIITAINKNISKTFQYLDVIIFNIVSGIILGLIINGVNKNISLKSIKFNKKYFIVSIVLLFCLCLIFILLLNGYLPSIFTQFILNSYLFISVFIGANIISSIFDNKSY